MIAQPPARDEPTDAAETANLPGRDGDHAAAASACLGAGLRRARSVLIVVGSLAAVIAVANGSTGDERLAVLILTGMIVGSAAITAIALGRRDETADRRHTDGSAKARVVTLIALLLGSAWGALPVLLFAGAPSDGRLLLLAAVAAVICCGYRLVPFVPAAVAFLAPIYAGGIVGLLRAGTPTSLGLAVLAALIGALSLPWMRESRDGFAETCAERRRAKEATATLDELLFHVEEGVDDWLWETDKVGRLRAVSPRLATAAGLPAAQLEGMRLRNLLAPEGRKRAEGTQAVCTALVQHRPFRNRMVDWGEDGAPRWWRMSGVPVHSEDGLFSGFRGIACDLTQSRLKEERITFLADHDALTGIANRSYFAAQAAAGCAASEADGRWRALMSLDLDDFKIVNDKFGHAAGDLLLRMTAERLRRMTPSTATVARLGADEFAVWLDAAPPAKTEALAQSIIEALNAPFDLDGETVTIGVSIGIAFAPKHGTTFDALLKRADLARYRAGNEARNAARVFLEADEHAIVARRRFDTDLRLAFAGREFVVYYQPLVDLAHGAVVGFEALVRWNSPTRGFVSPADFIPAAEASGLIVEIGGWVLQQACRDAASWPETVRVAVNVSPQQFRAAGFIETIRLALAESGLAPNRLEIEITEGVLLADSASTRATLDILRGRGVRVALDDFGTGYSSLSYLVDLPVDKIKIDQSFIRNLFERRQSEVIVDAILGLAKKLELTVIAEGVETADQAVALATRRCDQIQGFLVGRPRPAAEVPDMLESAPRLLREVMPVGQTSPLALALVMKKQTERTLREAS